MAWDNARIHVVFPRWLPVVEAVEPETRGLGGAPIRIVTFVMERSAAGGPVDRQALLAWLTRNGFTTKETYANGTLEFEQGDMTVDVHPGELSSLTFTFQLAQTSPSRIGKWFSLVVDACDLWECRIFDPRHDSLAEGASFFDILANTPGWDIFSRDFNWRPMAELVAGLPSEHRPPDHGASGPAAECP